MRKLGANKAALYFRSKENKPQKTVDDASSQSSGEDFDERSTESSSVIAQIQFLYKRQQILFHNYKKLFLFLGFVGLFLGVLYQQRIAHVAYSVHETLQDVVLPQESNFSSKDDVYNWVQNLLQAVWKDPICGDGSCEAPFEFASYGRFGCRADSGKLNEVQNLTAIQVDIYYDFTHPLGSMPAADLMQQAFWNLCPVDSAYAKACYFDSDIGFSELSGEQHYNIDDAPDGNWTLVVKRDMFDKVRGAVRDTKLLLYSAFYSKIYIALAAAQAEQKFEVELLQAAERIASTSFFDWIWSSWVGSNATALHDEFDLQQLKAASCLCTNGKDALSGTAFYNSGTYSANNCTGQTLLNRTWNGIPYNYTNGSFTAAPVTNSSTHCEMMIGNLTDLRASMTNALASLLVTQRLGNRKDTGKFLVRVQVKRDISAYIQSNFPELEDPIFNTPTGSEPFTSPVDCQLDTLIDAYITSPAYSSGILQADLAIGSKSKITNVSYADLRQRAGDRVIEIQTQTNSTQNMIIAGPYGRFSLEKIADIFRAAGANASYIPPPSSQKLGSFMVNYNLVMWAGNATAYLECDLSTREPSYIGTCVPMEISCNVTTNDTTPYICQSLTTNATVPGNLSIMQYRETCELPCDHQLDCDGICECFETCNSTQICTCPACVAMAAASSDPEFGSVASSVTGSATVIADVNSGRRKLLQDNTTQILSQVLSQIQTVSTGQTKISTDMTTMQAVVQSASSSADTRNQAVLDLMKASRADLSSSQQRVEQKLDTIIGTEQAALALAQAAANSLNAIRDLSNKQATALASLEQAVQQQLQSIKVAASQNIITLAQALLLWKRSRRDRAYNVKASKLANTPCTFQPTYDHVFALDNGNNGTTNTARERNIGLANRVISGLLLHTWRKEDSRCQKSKFKDIQSFCSGKLDTHPYGVDPVFKSGTDLYDPDLDDVDGAIVTTYYNCSELKSPTYNVFSRKLNSTTNPPPYCADLYNAQETPYAFYPFELESLPKGFPFFYDINLSQDEAQQWFTYMQQGLYFDTHTRGMIAQLMTYNTQLRIFGSIRLTFDFSNGGLIQLAHQIYSLRMELYETPADMGRYAFEVILTILILCQLLWQLVRAWRSWVRTRSCCRFFRNPWHCIYLISNILLTVSISIWWYFVDKHAKVYKVQLRQDVYEKLSADAFYIKLANGGNGLASVWDGHYRLSKLIKVLNWYYAINGINILLLIARVLRHMHFQPRLGVVTRSLTLAGADLFHFLLIFSMVFLSYAMMAYLIFGNSIEEFSTFGYSINTCFEIILGNIDVNQELRALSGLQSVAGVLFFWSYELLVFMVLLNFLLAIIVDAFSSVKGNIRASTGIHTELSRLVTLVWQECAHRLSKDKISSSKVYSLLKEWSDTERLQAGLPDPSHKVSAKVLKIGDDKELGETDIKEALLIYLATHKEKEEEKKDVSPEEVNALVHEILQRFGVPEAAEGKKVANEPVDLHKERSRLVLALEDLAAVQRDLSESQIKIMKSHRQLADQQALLLAYLSEENGHKGTK